MSTNLDQHGPMANAIRALAMDAVEKAKSGHPGLPMGAADIATVLFTRFLKFDPADAALARPRPLRAVGRPRLDAALRAALSHGHAGHDARRAEALPPVGLEDAGPSRIRPHARRRDDDRARSARASPRRSAWRSRERLLAAEFGADLVDHHTYVLASDGDLMEGISQEAIALAGHLQPVAA